MGSPIEGASRKTILLSLMVILLLLLLLPDTIQTHRHHNHQHDRHHRRSLSSPIHVIDKSNLSTSLPENDSSKPTSDQNEEKSGSLKEWFSGKKHEPTSWLHLCPKRCPKLHNSKNYYLNRLHTKNENSKQHSRISEELPQMALICGSNGRLYSSLCHMRRDACKLDRAIWPVNQSNCNQLQSSNHVNQINADNEDDEEVDFDLLEEVDQDTVSDIEIDQDDTEEDQNDATNGDLMTGAISEMKLFKEKLLRDYPNNKASGNDTTPDPICTQDMYRQMLNLIAAKFNGESSEIFRHLDRNHDLKLTANELWLEDSESVFSSSKKLDQPQTSISTIKNYILEPISDDNPCSLSHLMLFEDKNHNDIIELDELIEAFKREHELISQSKSTYSNVDDTTSIIQWHANLGDSLELQCKLTDGSDMNEIEWLRNGVQLRQILNLSPQQQQQQQQHNRVLITNDSRLQLKDIQLYLAGSYTCRGRANQQKVRQQQQVHQLHVSVPARVTVRPEFQWAPIGSQAQLECQYEYLPLTRGSSNEVPKVRWFKNGQEFVALADRKISLSGNDVRQNNSTQDIQDDGFYEYDSQLLIRQQQSDDREIDDEIAQSVELQLKASISMSSSRLTINPLAPADTGSISCQVSLHENASKSTISSDYGSLLVQDDPARIVNNDLDSGREHLWLFHDNGITIYSLSMIGADDQVQLVRDFTGHATIPPEIDNNWNQLTLCGGLSPDEAVICEWSDNAILIRPQFGGPPSAILLSNHQRNRHRKQQIGYVYVGQPNLNRILVFDSQQFEIVSILNTDPQPKQLWLYNSYQASAPNQGSSTSSGSHRIRSPMEHYRRGKDSSGSYLDASQFRSDIWILCHGQPLMVDTTNNNLLNNLNGAMDSGSASRSDLMILNEITNQLIPIKYNNKQPAGVQSNSNNWQQQQQQQQQISSKEQMLRNRKSVQIIRATTRQSSSDHHSIRQQHDNQDQQMPMSDSLKRFKLTNSIASYHLKSDHPFGLIHDLYMPHIATPLLDNYKHHVQYAYVSHYDERKLVRINMDKMTSDNIIDLGDCVPIYQLTTATGLLIIQCRTPITHQLKGQLVLDQLTNSFISYNPDIQAQRSFLSPDHRYLISIYTVYNNSNNDNQQQQPRIKLSPNISTSTTTTTTNNGNTGRKFASAKIIVQKITSRDLEFQYDVKTSLYIIDCAFVWKNGDYDAILVSGLGQQDEILSLRLLDGRVELISGILGRIANQHSSLKVSDRSKLAAIATDKGVYVLDMEDNRVKCQVPKHHQFTSATLLWV